MIYLHKMTVKQANKKQYNHDVLSAFEYLSLGIFNEEAAQ